MKLFGWFKSPRSASFLSRTRYMTFVCTSCTRFLTWFFKWYPMYCYVCRCFKWYLECFLNISILAHVFADELPIPFPILVSWLSKNRHLQQQDARTQVPIQRWSNESQLTHHFVTFPVWKLFQTASWMTWWRHPSKNHVMCGALYKPHQKHHRYMGVSSSENGATPIARWMVYFRENHRKSHSKMDDDSG